MSLPGLNLVDGPHMWRRAILTALTLVIGALSAALQMYLHQSFLRILTRTGLSGLQLVSRLAATQLVYKLGRLYVDILVTAESA